MTSPTTLSLRLLGRSGYAAGIVERFVQPPGRDGFRVDLFGCIDLVAVKRSEPGVLAVQATSLPNMSSRITKAKGKAELRAWVGAGNRFEVWGWTKRAGRWRVKRTALTGEGLAAAVIVTVPRRDRQKHQRGLFDE